MITIVFEKTLIKSIVDLKNDGKEADQLKRNLQSLSR